MVSDMLKVLKSCLNLKCWQYKFIFELEKIMNNIFFTSNNEIIFLILLINKHLENLKSYSALHILKCVTTRNKLHQMQK